MYNHITIKNFKHIRDSCYGHIVHTMAAGASQLASCVKYEENGETTNSVFEDMITKIAFGQNTTALPDLTGLILGYDRGYVFRDFISKMVDCGARIHSTLKRCLWDPITYDQNISDKDQRTMMAYTGIPTLLLKHSNFKSNEGRGSGTKLTLGAYRTDMGSICMLMLTEYHSNHWDIIPRYLNNLELCKNDLPSLHKKRFKLSATHNYDGEDGNDDDETNSLYYSKFKDMPVDMVTTSQGTKEWHLC